MFRIKLRTEITEALTKLNNKAGCFEEYNLDTNEEKLIFLAGENEILKAISKMKDIDCWINFCSEKMKGMNDVEWE